MTNTPDRIERSIDIDAPAERVWALASRPGWWINDGTVADNEVQDRGDHVVVRSAAYGEFVLQVVELDPPVSAEFRWHSGSSGVDAGPDEPTTLVRFTVEPRPAGGVTLRVVESGFAALPADRRADTYRQNDEGWASQLSAVPATVTRQDRAGADGLERAGR